MQLYRSAASFATRWTMNAWLLTVASAGRRRFAQVPQQGSRQSLCNRPHGWKELNPSCRRSPRSELEVFYARNEFTVLAFPFILSGAAAEAKRARASILN